MLPCQMQAHCGCIYGRDLSQGIGPVAITIRNKQTEELIRRIGRRTGEGPSAVVARAVEALSQSPDTVSEDEKRRKFESLMKLAPPRDPSVTWKDIESDMDSIF